MPEAKTASVNITLFYVNQGSSQNDVTAETQKELHVCFVVHPQLFYYFDLNIVNFIFYIYIDGYQY